ncbi:HAD family hydrolase [Novosphingobium panipatense]
MSEVDWQDIRLTIFDLDGTLYDQPPLRRAMAWSLLRDAVRKRSLRTILILRCFRRVRERLGEQTAGTGCGNFLREQYLETAVACGIDEGEVRACVEEWMERRPLALLSRYKAAGIDDLFAAIRATGRAVAVWSDYPVAAKLAALGLEADHAIWAGDSAVGRLKPDPKGLRILLSRAGVPAR